jgi:hypothetical protein
MTGKLQDQGWGKAQNVPHLGSTARLRIFFENVFLDCHVNI